MGYFEIASEQHGLATRQQAIDNGLSDKRVAALCRTGALERVHPGIVRVAGAPRTWQQRVQLALLAAGDRAAVSHATAAVLFGLEGFARSRIEVSVPRGSCPRDVPATVHRPMRLEVVHVGGFPSTPIERTLLDVSARLGFEKLLRTTDEALRRRLTTVGKLRTFVAHDRRGDAGARVLRNVMAEIGPDDARRDSGLEDAFVAVLRDSPVPRLVSQFAVHAGRRKIGTVDFALPEACIAVELSHDTYHTGLRKDRDAELANRLALAGWLLLTFTDRQVRGRPKWIRDQLESAVLRRAPDLLRSR